MPVQMCRVAASRGRGCGRRGLSEARRRCRAWPEASAARRGGRDCPARSHRGRPCAHTSAARLRAAPYRSRTVSCSRSGRLAARARGKPRGGVRTCRRSCSRRSARIGTAPGSSSAPRVPASCAPAARSPVRSRRAPRRADGPLLAPALHLLDGAVQSRVGERHGDARQIERLAQRRFSAVRVEQLLDVVQIAGEHPRAGRLTGRRAGAAPVCGIRTAPS